ncbi:MAG: hypothetical protein WAU96_04860 [Anaerolineae bacterium]
MYRTHPQMNLYLQVISALAFYQFMRLLKISPRVLNLSSNVMDCPYIRQSPCISFDEPCAVMQLSCLRIEMNGRLRIARAFCQVSFGKNDIGHENLPARFQTKKFGFFKRMQRPVVIVEQKITYSFGEPQLRLAIGKAKASCIGEDGIGQCAGFFKISQHPQTERSLGIRVYAPLWLTQSQEILRDLRIAFEIVMVQVFALKNKQIQKIANG